MSGCKHCRSGFLGNRFGQDVECVNGSDERAREGLSWRLKRIRDDNLQLTASDRGFFFLPKPSSPSPDIEQTRNNTWWVNADDPETAVSDTFIAVEDAFRKLTGDGAGGT